MLSLKLGVAAVLLELAAWGGPLWLGARSDSALASYLLVHALACVMLSLMLFPLLAPLKARPRRAIVLLMAVCSYAVPVAGFVGVVVGVIVLRVYRRPARNTAFEAVHMPEFDQHQHRQTSFRHAGLRSFLGNNQAPVESRMRAMAALQYTPGRTASPLLRSSLSDPSEDLRLLAYGMLDTLEKRINSAIDTELDALQAAQKAEGQNASGPRTLEAAQRLSDLHWELIYQELVQGDLREHAIGESLRYCEWVLQAQPEHAPLHLRRGRLLHAQGHLAEAAEAYTRARAAGAPATRVLPYQAELCFDRKDFLQARALVRELQPWNALPRLQPMVDYWGSDA